MIIKEYLLEQGVDLQCFEQFHRRPAKARRKLNQTFGGEITVPTLRTSTEIKEHSRFVTLFFGLFQITLGDSIGVFKKYEFFRGMK